MEAGFASNGKRVGDWLFRSDAGHELRGSYTPAGFQPELESMKSDPDLEPLRDRARRDNRIRIEDVTCPVPPSC